MKLKLLVNDEFVNHLEDAGYFDHIPLDKEISEDDLNTATSDVFNKLLKCIIEGEHVPRKLRKLQTDLILNLWLASDTHKKIYAPPKEKIYIGDGSPICGVYFLFDQEELVYVGQSTNIRKRVYEHVGSKKFDSYSFKVMPEELLLQEEARYILRCRPKYNRECSSRLSHIIKTAKLHDFVNIGEAA